MKSLFEIANDAPKLSKHELDVIARAHDQKLDRCILKKTGLQDMEKMENWGIP